MKQLICIFVICSLSGTINAAQEVKNDVSDKKNKVSIDLTQKAKVQTETTCDPKVTPYICKKSTNKTTKRVWWWVTGQNTEFQTQGEK